MNLYMMVLLCTILLGIYLRVRRHRRIMRRRAWLNDTYGTVTYH